MLALGMKRIRSAEIEIRSAEVEQVFGRKADQYHRKFRPVDISEVQDNKKEP
jgi:hypothetical protein